MSARAIISDNYHAPEVVSSFITMDSVRKFGALLDVDSVGNSRKQLRITQKHIYKLRNDTASYSALRKIRILYKNTVSTAESVQCLKLKGNMFRVKLP
jgi:hypothetical protein